MGTAQRLPIAGQLKWPHLMRPRVPLVYLDLNHLVGLAQVRSGHRAADVSYRRLWQASVRAAAEKRVVFPISQAHVWEVLKVSDPKQRDGLATVIEILSGFHYMLGGEKLVQLEFDAGVAAALGEASDDVIGLPLLRNTIGHAFGMVGGLKIVDAQGRDKTDDVRRATGSADFDAKFAAMHLEFERRAIRGPADDAIEDLRTNRGYKPDVPLASHESRVGFERETANILDDNPGWRQGRLRDFIAAREFCHEWIDIIAQHRVDRLQADEPTLTTEQLGAVMSGMPLVQVAISMKTHFHRNPAHVWNGNLLTDIDAMSAAFAYCEAVFTDKEARNALVSSTDLRRFGTFTPRKPDELTEWLDALPPVVAPDIQVPHPLMPRPEPT